jgi:hypothetical protein
VPVRRALKFSSPVLRQAQDEPGEELRARCTQRARVRWGAVVRLVLTVRVVRAVPHLIAMVATEARGAPPPFGGGKLVRVAATRVVSFWN